MQSFAEPRYYGMFKRHLDDYLSADPAIARLGQVRSTIPHNTMADTMENYRQEKQILTSVNTKRVIFDARQATIFDKSEIIPVEGFKIQPPFDQIYIEFTEPVELQSQEPGFFDKLVGILYVHEPTQIPIRTEDGDKIYPASMVIFILFNEELFQWTDRAFRFSLEHKLAFPAVQNVRLTAEPSEVPKEWENFSWFVSNMKIPGMENRQIGWWESAIESYSQLLYWMFSYMMAKSVKIEEVPVSRQVRRAMERKGEMPRPWHRVMVEPKLVMKHQETGESHNGPDYRYDVITHLRFNKHKLKTGAYRFTVEVVPAHQRGLKNEIYIPKTYVVEGGRKILPETGQYFGPDTKFP
jgi:hypothetical protein